LSHKMLAVGHILIDMRVLVDEMSSSDQLNPVNEISYGVGGSAANFAIGARRLGGECVLVGKIGMDEFGRMAVDELMREKVPLDEIKVDLVEKTGYTIVIINKHGEVFMFGSKEASEALTPDEVKPIGLQCYRSVHIASLRIDTSMEIAKRASRKGIIVTFDPGRVLVNKGIQYLCPLFRYVDTLLINQRESKALTGLDDPEKSSLELRRVGARNVIIKLGKRGVFYLEDSKSGIVPAFEVKAIDTTGAGDAFAVGLTTALGERCSLLDAVTYANAVAALKVTKLGAHSIPTKKEVEEFLSARGI